MKLKSFLNSSDCLRWFDPVIYGLINNHVFRRDNEFDFIRRSNGSVCGFEVIIDFSLQPIDLEVLCGLSKFVSISPRCDSKIAIVIYE